MGDVVGDFVLEEEKGGGGAGGGQEEELGVLGLAVERDFVVGLENHFVAVHYELKVEGVVHCKLV